MNGMVPGAREVSYECGEGAQSGGRTKVTEEVSSHHYYSVTTWGERTPMRSRHSWYHSQYSGQCPHIVKDAFEMSSTAGKGSEILLLLPFPVFECGSLLT